METNRGSIELADISPVPPKKKGETLDFKEDQFFGQTRLKEEDLNPAEDAESLIVMKNVHKTYLLGIEGVPALRGVSLTVERGEFVCIFGTSGGGKTTMLNIMGTIDKPTKGELKLCGVRINSATKDFDLSMIRLQKIGFVFQTFNLLSSLTALENVEMPMILNGVLSAAERKQRATELLTMVGMGKRLDHVPSQLSGGEQQRVTIARAIANNPELLLLDEPTGDLDTVNTLVVLKLLMELNQKNNITMVMVTHDVGLKSFADRVIWMRDGRISRIEVMSTVKKQEALAKLDKDLDDVKERKKLTKAGDVTEYRIPTDYKTSVKYKQREIPFTSPSLEVERKGNGIASNGANGTHPSQSDDESERSSSALLKKKQDSNSSSSSKEERESDDDSYTFDK
eukprot:TRINITY_DN5736_c0_g1_i1.p1 TRINITY_DN5736_c0_g1~~TRINITY_DN5736_c0_g1_i1.p1  ORF type:complete len:398 (-),score=124.06 TRINITY_DN5736_c0_g1_i1:198-1391(-)